MTPTPETKKVNRTVFDLTTLERVTLEKEIPLPPKPTSVEEALSAVGNDSKVLLEVIYDGLVERAAEQAKATMDGFTVENDDGETVLYTGTFADESKGKLISNFILAYSKMQGFDKSLPKEKKRAIKESAYEFLRSNPAIVASMQS